MDYGKGFELRGECLLSLLLGYVVVSVVLIILSSFGNSKDTHPEEIILIYIDGIYYLSFFFYILY
jgi:hypothetical protein